MAKLMFQFRMAGKGPTSSQVSAKYDIKPSEIDPEFGIVQSDREQGLYVALVDEAARSRIESKLAALGEDADPAVGVFSNPPIEPFGPPEAGE